MKRSTGRGSEYYRHRQDSKGRLTRLVTVSPQRTARRPSPSGRCSRTSQASPCSEIECRESRRVSSDLPQRPTEVY